MKEDNTTYTCTSGEWVKNDGKDSGKSDDKNSKGDKGSKDNDSKDSGKDEGSKDSDGDGGKTPSGDNDGDSSGDNGDGTPFSFGPAGASLTSEMFESLAGTEWADKEFILLSEKLIANLKKWQKKFDSVNPINLTLLQAMTQFAEC